MCFPFLGPIGPAGFAGPHGSANFRLSGCWLCWLYFVMQGVFLLWALLAQLDQVFLFCKRRQKLVDQQSHGGPSAENPVHFCLHAYDVFEEEGEKCEPAESERPDF
eukprot:1145488-Pelagomonas_calceolata.AAC.2